MARSIPQPQRYVDAYKRPFLFGFLINCLSFFINLFLNKDLENSLTTVLFLCKKIKETGGKAK